MRYTNIHKIEQENELSWTTHSETSFRAKLMKCAIDIIPAHGPDTNYQIAIKLQKFVAISQ